MILQDRKNCISLKIFPVKIASPFTIASHFFVRQMSGLLQFTVRLSAETEAIFTSVERLVHYIDNLKQEAPSSIPEKKPADDWPGEGSLSMVGLKVSHVFFRQ